jgi:hypothetical protein
MRAIRQIFFAVCGVILLTSTGTTAFEAPSRKALRFYPSSTAGVVQLRDQSDIALSPPHRAWHCRVSGARAERIERNTSNPCLAADSTPGGVCFERLGQSTTTNPSALLDSWDAPCGP